MAPPLKFEWKIWAEKRTECKWRPFFFIFTFLVFIFLIRFLSTFSNFGLCTWPPLSKILRPPLEQGSATYIPYPAHDLKHPSEIPNMTSGSRWPRNQILLWNYPNIWRNLFFFLRVLNYKSAKNYHKFGEYLFLFLFFFQMIPKQSKLYSNGVKITIFFENHKHRTKWPHGLGRRLPIRRPLCATRLVAPVYSERRSRVVPLYFNKCQ